MTKLNRMIKTDTVFFKINCIEKPYFCILHVQEQAQTLT